MARIAVGGFQHETNTFAPHRATWDDFARADAWPGFVRGPELIEAVEGYNIPIAGAVETAAGARPRALCRCAGARRRPPPMSSATPTSVLPARCSTISPRTAPLQAGSTASISTCTARWSPSITTTARANCLRRIRAAGRRPDADRRQPRLPHQHDPGDGARMPARWSATAPIRISTWRRPAAAPRRCSTGCLRERRPLYKAYRQIDFLIPLVFQCTDAEPARGIFALIDEIERGGVGGFPRRLA